MIMMMIMTTPVWGLFIIQKLVLGVANLRIKLIDCTVQCSF